MIFLLIVAITYAIAYVNEFTLAYDVYSSLGSKLYCAPHTRVLPYLVGVVAGYLTIVYNRKLPLKRSTIRILWAISIFTAILCHLSTTFRHISHHVAASTLAASRVLYGISIAWMIVASACGHGGVFARILNFRGFRHVGKLTFAIYLIHPTIIILILNSRDQSTHYEPVSTVFICLPTQKVTVIVMKFLLDTFISEHVVGFISSIIPIRFDV